MPRYHLTISYDGSDFCGWQRQPHSPSIQEHIEQALAKLTQETPTLHCSGRTDTGVHAIAQSAHFSCHKELQIREIIHGLNFHIAHPAIAIIEARTVCDDFHARFSAKQRHYRYIIHNGAVASPFWHKRAWHSHYPIDDQAVTEACQYFLGHHDFTSFRAQGCQANHAQRSIDLCQLERHQDMIVITISARSFLYHQIRNMVGTLHKIGNGKQSPQWIKELLELKDRSQAGMTAPPHGLYFLGVDYENYRPQALQKALDNPFLIAC